MNPADNIATLRARSSHDELQRINRLTGLQFHSVPESLVRRQEEWEIFAESLLGEAITTWNDDPRRAEG